MKQLGFILGLDGRSEQIKFWVPTLLLGGMMGVPAVEGIGTLYQWTAGRMFGFLFEALGFYKDDEDEEREIGEVSGKAKVANILRGHPVTEAKKYLMEWAEDDPTKKRVAESIMYGMAAHLGVDISRRVGLGDMLPERGSDYAGPSVSSLLQFYVRAQEGWDWTEQLRILAPSVGNIATGIEWYLNDGKVYDPYNRQNLKYYATTKDMFFRAAGLRNTVEAKISDTRRVEDAHQRAVQSASHSIVDKYIDAHQKGDRERADQILKDGIEYLQGRFGKGTHITPESVKAALKGRVLPDGLRRVMGAPKVDKPRQGKYNDFIGEAATRLPQERGE